MMIGFVGAGAMGRPIAANLLRAGHALRVNDLRRDAAAPLVAAGAQWADTAASAARDAELVFTSLPGPAEVEAAAAGSSGLIAAMRPGAAWFDLTTNAPDTVRRLHDQCSARGVRMLDAPVSGGPSAAADGTLAIWVGGDAATFEQHRPVLAAIGKDPLHVGAIGAGTVAKLAHNCASFAVQTALAEAITLGVKAGVAPLALFRALRQGALGRRRTFDRLAEQFLPGSYDPPAHALELAHKDMMLVLALAEACDVPVPVARIAMAELAEAMARGWGGRDARVAMTLQEERAGVSVKVPPERLRDALS